MEAVSKASFRYVQLHIVKVLYLAQAINSNVLKKMGSENNNIEEIFDSFHNILGRVEAKEAYLDFDKALIYYFPISSALNVLKKIILLWPEKQNSTDNVLICTLLSRFIIELMANYVYMFNQETEEEKELAQKKWLLSRERLQDLDYEGNFSIAYGGMTLKEKRGYRKKSNRKKINNNMTIDVKDEKFRFGDIFGDNFFNKVDLMSHLTNEEKSLIYRDYKIISMYSHANLHSVLRSGFIPNLAVRSMYYTCIALKQVCNDVGIGFNIQVFMHTMLVYYFDYKKTTNNNT